MPDDKERPPVPHYLPSWEGTTNPLAEKYPLQLLVPHARYSFHTHAENASFIRWIPYHRGYKNGYNYWLLHIHQSDAEPRGIKDGDLVRAYNDRGAVILIARATEKIVPGTVYSRTAGGYDPVEPGKIGSLDRGGAVNLLMSSRLQAPNAPGQVNQCLVEIEKWEG